VGSLGGQLRVLSPEAFLLLLEAVGAAVERILNRAGKVKQLVEATVTGHMRSPLMLADVPLGGAGRERTSKEVLRTNTAVVTTAVEAAHGRWAKLLGVRAGIHSKLRQDAFSAVTAATEAFISNTEAHAGQRCRSLRTTLHSQAKAFLDTMHTGNITKMASLLEGDNWQPARVDRYFQLTVNWLLKAAEVAEALDQPEPSTTGS
jgi:vacuolar protein sorting-associated protein 54